MKTFFKYDSKKNPDERSFISGVPLADITETRWNKFGIQQQKSVVASELYKPTKDFDVAAFEKSLQPEAAKEGNE